MARQTKDSKKKAASKKEETKKKKPLPTTARKVKKVAKPSKAPAASKTKPAVKAKAAPSKKPAKKTKPAAKPTLKKAAAAKRSKTTKKPAPKATATKKKTTAKPAPKAAAAKKKPKSSVKSINNTSKTKKTETKRTKTTATTARKPTKAAKKSSAATKPAKTAAAGKKTAVTGKRVAARRAEDARPAKEKEQEPKLEQQKAAESPIKSEAAAKVAKSLLRRKAAKKGAAAAKPKPVRPIAFTLDEALEIAKSKPEAKKGEHKGNGASPGKPVAQEKQKKELPEDVKQENRVLGAASVADILGYNPAAGPKKSEEADIPPKYSRYYKLLIELRDHVLAGLDTHTRETLKRSAKDDSGDLSSYSQHMADAGTDTFDRDFALSLVSSEQDALYEIEDAIRRIKRGTYGICEITGKPIKKERLLAVPFAKFSVEGQIEYERTHRKSAYRGGAFSDTSEEGVQFMEEESDE